MEAGAKPMSDDQQQRGKSAPQQTANWRPRPCPICARMSVPEYRPFCSKRCADVDLGRWLNGNYSFNGGPAPQNPTDD